LVSVGEIVFGGISITGIMENAKPETIIFGLIAGGILIIAGVFLQSDEEE
jgi:hypothetical protein